MSSRRIAILSTPCSGTGFMALALQAVGLRVGHEVMADDGVVCGWAIFGAHQVKLSDYRFDVVAQLIRHPCSVLETLPTYAAQPARGGLPALWQDGDPVVAALKWWVLAHEAIPEVSTMDTLALERIEEGWPRLLEALGEPVVPVPELPRKSKAKRWPRLELEELPELDPEYGPRALALWERLG